VELVIGVRKKINVSEDIEHFIFGVLEKRKIFSFNF
jgi:hypothetical protein